VPYIADAKYSSMPLLADGLIHDWNFILLRLNLMPEYLAIARYVRLWGGVVLVVSLISAWVMVFIVEKKKAAG
jgi:hypothetical protein